MSAKKSLQLWFWVMIERLMITSFGVFLFNSLFNFIQTKEAYGAFYCAITACFFYIAGDLARSEYDRLITQKPSLAKKKEKPNPKMVTTARASGFHH